MNEFSSSSFRLLSWRHLHFLSPTTITHTQFFPPDIMMMVIRFCRGVYFTGDDDIFFPCGCVWNFPTPITCVNLFLLYLLIIISSTSLWIWICTNFFFQLHLILFISIFFNFHIAHTHTHTSIRWWWFLIIIIIECCISIDNQDVIWYQIFFLPFVIWIKNQIVKLFLKYKSVICLIIIV